MPVSFENVSYIYNRKSPFEYAALKGINLVLPDGGFYALVGKTGSGKSTLVSHINALLNPTEGVVKIDDFINCSTKKGRSKDLLSLRKKVGLVFQFPEYQLFEETVEKDVAFAPRNFGASKEEAIKQAHEALTKVGLDASFYPRSPFELSGGEKRKVAIAGILAAKPKILIVDEPTAGLDPMASLETMDLFSSIHKEGVTIILVTHDMNLVAKYASEVVVLEDGKIDRVSKPSDLFKEDISMYSLETPLLYKVAKDLNAKGYKLDISSISSADDLASQIAKEKR
jgi:energy-coupling factor transport system ATP-binding protein